MSGKYSIEYLKYSLPDYIAKKMEDKELESEIESRLKTDFSLKEEYESIKKTFNFLDKSDFENPPEYYFNNLPLKINKRLDGKNRASEVSFWDKLSLIWKIFIPAVPVIILAIVLLNDSNSDLAKDKNQLLKEDKSVEEKSEAVTKDDIVMRKEPEINNSVNDNNDKFIKDGNTVWSPKLKKTAKTKIKIKNTDPDLLTNPIEELDDNIYADTMDEFNYEESEEEENLFYSDDDETESLEMEFLELTPEQQKEILDNLNNTQI